jgi:hypothetical protein
MAANDPIADIDIPFCGGEHNDMIYRSFRAVSWQASTALMGLSISVQSAATTPLPPPTKLAQDFSFSCLILSPQKPAMTLSIKIRYQQITEKNSFYQTAYWWSLLGDDQRFPSNQTFMNMRSLETFEPTSTLYFQAADGWGYHYSLYYGVEERYPGFVYVPDHLVIRRRRADAGAGATAPATPNDWQLVGIGECRLNSEKPAL